MCQSSPKNGPSTSLSPGTHVLCDPVFLSVGWIYTLSSNKQNMAVVMDATSEIRL